jgi:hypothetical protein
MKNEAASAVHRLSTRRGGAAVYRNGAYWLTKRRDGASDVWVVAWYQPEGRLVRYRSTRCRDLSSAKTFLDRHALANPISSAYRNPEYREPSKVYFIGGDIGAIKIGAAHDPAARLKTLQCGSPIPIRLLAIADGCHEVEREYHRQFAAHRLHGEWFERCPEIEAEIGRLNSAPLPTPEAGER